MQTVSPVECLSQGLASEFHHLRKSKLWFFSPPKWLSRASGYQNYLHLQPFLVRGAGIHKCFSFGVDAL